MNKDTIEKELLVAAPQQTSFEVFTNGINNWWPSSHHIGAAPMKELIIEPFVNGRWYSTHEDGSEANVGNVKVWQPYERLVLSWNVNEAFQYDPNLDTEVEVLFIAEGDNNTLIKFTHRGLSKFSQHKTFEEMDGGWGMILDLFKANIQKQ
ncbi:SRPBCC family protein [Ferruginibacter sp.]